MSDQIIGVLAIAGAAFVLVAGVGVLRFPDLYARMHAATKATTIAIVLLAIAGVIALEDGRAKIILAAAMIFVTTPAGSHFVARAAYRAEGIEMRLDSGDDLATLMDETKDDAGDSASS